MTVERSVNDLVLVDDALDESMLKPELQKSEIRENTDIKLQALMKLSQLMMIEIQAWMK